MKTPFVLVINGSSRKEGKTFQYLKEVIKGIKKEKARYQLLHLIDFNILPCLGCVSQNPSFCTFPCVVKDDMQKIYPLLIECSAIVIGSPSYWFSVPGNLKNFIDRLTSLEHERSLLEEKIFAAVGVAKESGGEEVSHYLISVFNEMGCIIPPFATPFFNNKGEGSWRKKDLVVLGRNIVRLARIIKKAKLL
jgi:multimeric flavodoxin WrbA